MSRLTKEQADDIDRRCAEGEAMPPALFKGVTLTTGFLDDDPSKYRRRILDLKDELAARWQTIVTAPKDGTQIRAYGTRHGSWGYSEDELVSIDAAWCKTGQRWIDVRDQAFIPRRFTPTHWMPLPEPPQ